MSRKNIKTLELAGRWSLEIERRVVERCRGYISTTFRGLIVAGYIVIVP